MNPIFLPERARDLALILAVAVPVAVGVAVVLALRRGRRAGPAEASALSAWFWLLIVGAGVALGATQAGSRRGSGGLVALAALAAAASALGAAGVAASHRLTYRASLRAERRAARGDVAGAIAALRASVDRRLRRAAPAASADAWAAPPSVVDRDLVLAMDLGTLGYLEGLRGDWAAALAHLREAEQFGDGLQVAQARALQGDALLRLGRHDEGVARLRAAVDLLPPGDAATRSRLGLHLAAALIELGRPGGGRRGPPRRHRRLGPRGRPRRRPRRRRGRGRRRPRPARRRHRRGPGR